MKSTKAKWMYLAVVAMVISLGTSAHAQLQSMEMGGPIGFGYKLAGEMQEHTISFEANIEGPVVTGAPYTAKAVTNTTQTLSDGNKIKHTTEVNLARDSEGRTRREQSIASFGPWETNAKGQIIVISDPVAHVRYELGPERPDGSKMIARKSEMFERMRGPETRSKMMIDAGRPVGGNVGVGVGVGAGVGVDEMGTNVVIVTNEGENAMFEKRIQEGPGPGVPGQKDAKVEQLGEQTIEGVTAKGTRRTVTIPAGQIGNEQPISIVSESWYSPELKMTVLSKRNDPRMGETEFRLTNIQRGEPAPSLFQVPAGYELKDNSKREF
jgi:hypothetical protein